MAVNNKPNHFPLQTKLNRPGVTRDLVIRPRLLELLDKGLEGSLTLVVSPAGFGKTTLISSWAQSLAEGARGGVPLPVAWLSLDESDGDRDVFLRYFVASVRTIFPDACTETLALLNARQEPAAGVITELLSNELEMLPSRFVVVLDDMHTSHGQSIFEGLSGWLRHWPRLLHLIILSRFNPPIPLATLRAKGLLTEIRVRELRFSDAEAAEYIERVAGLSLDKKQLSLLQQRLEGWIAGLKLASLSLADRETTPEALSEALLESDGLIADYLMDEVFDSLSPAMRDFLLKSAIPEQFCASLCEALLDEDDPACDARACLDQLDSADLFVTPLDNRRQWYRLHPVFRDLLRQRLMETSAADEVDELHVRAANWFAEHDLPDQAIHHALEAGNLETAAQFMQQGLCDVLNREDRPVLERWLRLIPDDFIERRPELLLMRAFAHGFRWELDRSAAAAARAEALMDDQDLSERAETLRGLSAVLKGSTLYSVNEFEHAVVHSKYCLAKLPERWRYARGVAAIYLGISLAAGGRFEAAETFLQHAYESSREKSDSHALRLLLAQVINSNQAGDYERTKRTAETMLRQAEPGQHSVIEGWAHYLLGAVTYEWNLPDAAGQHFAEVTRRLYTANLATVRNGFIGQALACQAQGRSGDALEAMDQLSRIDFEYHGREMDDTASARARLMLMQANLEAAERWADEYSVLPENESLVVWLEQPHLTRATILIARNKPGDVAVALQILDRIAETAERSHNNRVMIRTLALQALAQVARGDSVAARESLVRSVELARRGAFTRLYVDLGQPMRNLLLQTATNGATANTVNRILAAFADDGQETPNGQPSRSGYPTANGQNGDLDERLTPRELEVLMLMREPVSLKVIAARLNITYATARRYTINVYSKFGVHSRWEAVDIAIQSGILPPR